MLVVASARAVDVSECGGAGPVVVVVLVGADVSARSVVASAFLLVLLCFDP